MPQRAAWLLSVVLAAPVLQAQTAEAPVRSPAPARQALDGPAGADPKARVREAARTPGGVAGSKAQHLKQAVKDAESSKPAGWLYEADNSACGFLTKPHVRPDGGGLNAHKGGQVLCFQGRVMHCLQGRWRDRGACSATDSYPPQAWQMEGSPPQAGISPPDGTPGGPVGQAPQSPEGEVPGGTALLGESPLSSEIEEEMQRLREREAELQRQRGEADRSTQGGSAPQPALPRRDAAKCAELRSTVTQADEALKQLRAYSRTQHDDGQISTAVRPQFNQIQSARQQALSMQSQLGCR